MFLLYPSVSLGLITSVFAPELTANSSLFELPTKRMSLVSMFSSAATSLIKSDFPAKSYTVLVRSEERRVGKER